MMRFSLFLPFAVLLLAGCGGKAPAPEKKDSAPVSVVVAPAILTDVPKTLRAVGNVEASHTVAVRARVDGELMEVRFREGDMVKVGQVLFEIDPRPYRAVLEEARATLVRHQAELGNAEAQAKRYQELLRLNFVSKEAAAQMQTNYEVAQANVAADEAALERARLNLEFCTIHSPISGKTGALMVHQGNLVRAQDPAPLVVVNKVMPVWASFDVPEKEILQARQAMQKGKVRVLAKADERNPSLGELFFIDNAAKPQTGTVRLKAAFANEDLRLWPGQFVTVEVLLGEEKGKVAVPSQALQVGPEGRFAYVLRQDGTVEAREVQAGRPFGDLTVVEKGLSPGEEVVVEGHLRLAPGIRVSASRRQGLAAQAKVGDSP